MKRKSDFDLLTNFCEGRVVHIRIMLRDLGCVSIRGAFLALSFALLVVHIICTMCTIVYKVYN